MKYKIIVDDRSDCEWFCDEFNGFYESLYDECFCDERKCVDLSEKINYMIEMGWEPLGGVSFAGNAFAQAMVYKD